MMMMMTFVSPCILMLACCMGVLAGDNPTVDIPGVGSVMGTRNNNANVFLGIPFAEPPVGALRFTRPVPATTPWKGVIDGTKYQPNCAQSKFFNPPMGETSEDCLYLNVFVPTGEAPAGGFPVTVWLHGGGYKGGGPNEVRLNATFNVGHFHDVITVVVAYRLNVFGFLGSTVMRASDPTHTTGNWGMLDQRMAMKWVSDHISAFGGNPKTTLLYGESAGAGSVSNHLVMENSFGLFSSAAMESGAFSPWISRTLACADEKYNELLTSTKCSDLDCLRGLSTETLLAATVGPGNVSSTVDGSASDGSACGIITWSPTIDGSELTAHPATLLAQGSFAKVPVIAGSVRDEGVAFAGLPFNLNEAGYQEFLGRFGAAAQPILEKLYPPSAYPNTPQITNYFWAAQRAYGDYLMACPAQRTVEAFSAQGLDAFLFLFARVPGDKGTFVYHAQDIPYVFHSDSLLPTPDDVTVADTTATYWMNFARTATPNLPSTVPQLWSKWNNVSAPSIRLDVNTTVQLHLKAPQCAFWQTYPHT